jgi:DNA-binding GntR family transcriptional regulator
MDKELCAEMGISRTPLREALNRLGLEGLVSLVPYHGFEVAPITLQDIRDMCELRCLVESEAAALAAQRATPEEIAELVELAELPYTPGRRETYYSYLRANSAFHLKLAHCSHNARLEAFVISLLDQLQRPLYLGLDVGLNAAAATAEHLAVVDAVGNRDSALAAALMRKQVSATEQRVISAFQGSELDGVKQ